VHHSAAVEKAVAHALGSTFICADAGAAKAVAFARETGGARCVTLDGDVYEPGGTLAGGAPPARGGRAEARADRAPRRRRGGAQRGVARGRARARDQAARAAAAHGPGRGQQCRARTMPPSSFVFALMQPQVGADVERLKAAAAEHEASAAAAADAQKAAAADAARLQKDMAEFKNNKEGKIDELKVGRTANLTYPTTTLTSRVQASIAKQKAALQKQTVVLKTHQKDVQAATLELGACRGLEGVSGGAKRVQRARSRTSPRRKARSPTLRRRSSCYKTSSQAKRPSCAIKRSVATASCVHLAYVAAQAEHAAADKKLKAERAQLSHFDDELKALEAVVRAQKQQAADAALALTKLEHEVVQLAKDRKTAATQAADLEAANEWIADEKACVRCVVGCVMSD
jgi:structural maintenance of chromosome 2